MDSRTRSGRLTRQSLLLARKGIVFVLGVAVVAVGIALLVLPGPGLLVIGLGLLLLATEFPWAKRLAHRLLGPTWERTKAWWAARRGGGPSPG